MLRVSLTKCAYVMTLSTLRLLPLAMALQSKTDLATLSTLLSDSAKLFLLAPSARTLSAVCKEMRLSADSASTSWPLLTRLCTWDRTSRKRRLNRRRARKTSSTTSSWTTPLCRNLTAAGLSRKMKSIRLWSCWEAEFGQDSQPMLGQTQQSMALCTLGRASSRSTCHSWSENDS